MSENGKNNVILFNFFQEVFSNQKIYNSYEKGVIPRAKHFRFRPFQEKHFIRTDRIGDKFPSISGS